MNAAPRDTLVHLLQLSLDPGRRQVGPFEPGLQDRGHVAARALRQGLYLMGIKAPEEM